MTLEIPDDTLKQELLAAFLGNFGSNQLRYSAKRAIDAATKELDALVRGPHRQGQVADDL